jgi:hypothetical protein
MDFAIVEHGFLDWNVVIGISRVRVNASCSPWRTHWIATPEERERNVGFLGGEATWRSLPPELEPRHRQNKLLTTRSQYSPEQIEIRKHSDTPVSAWIAFVPWIEMPRS